MRNILFGLGIILRTTIINIIIVIAITFGIYYTAFHVFKRFDITEELIRIARLGDIQGNIFDDGTDTTEIDFHYYWQIFKGSFFFFTFVGIGLSGFANILGTYYLQKQIRQCIDFTQKISQGNTKVILSIEQRDELGKLAENLRQVAANLQYTTQFAIEIGKGNTDFQISHQQQNAITVALKEIQFKLAEARKLEREENYIITGINQISEIVRHSNKDYSICHAVLKEMINYIKGFAGAFYTVENEKLQMQANYALSPKIIEERQCLLLGEGFVGQVAKTKNPILLSQVPAGYVKMQSYTGESESVHLTVLPITANDNIIGVVELAHISSLQNYQLQYLERACQIVGTTLLSIQGTLLREELLERTKRTALQLELSQNELQKQYKALQESQEEISRQKKQLEDQNIKIIQSIRYAQQIQKAILPTKSQRLSLLPESFLIYKPKDIVSGDFFWISQHGNKKLIGVIDCTGHGVPGAFMSLIGHSIISDAVYNQQILNPSKILNYLHAEVRKKLNQEEGANNDGMDIGLCLIEDYNNHHIRISYAGAKHKLFYTSNSEIHIRISDKFMIGGKNTSDVRNYTNQEFFLQKGDMIYLTTDGFIDQANPKRKSFNINRFKELIAQNYHLPAEEQQEIFIQALANHQQDAEQRDDITVLAFRL
ncbi:MAG: SpoIIE family protein phosphatase [Cytophagales bacterium]|nr:SpoIIE family protein phosphatase [Cytophagales bacterium]MDW8384598.1 SpoIIE family protein phosphatase [Flammeovirgaceae bacterium]